MRLTPAKFITRNKRSDDQDNPAKNRHPVAAATSPRNATEDTMHDSPTCLPSINNLDWRVDDTGMIVLGITNVESGKHLPFAHETIEGFWFFLSSALIAAHEAIDAECKGIAGNASNAHMHGMLSAAEYALAGLEQYREDLHRGGDSA